MRKAMIAVAVLMLSALTFSVEMQEEYNGHDFVCEGRYDVGSNSYDVCELLNRYFIAGYVAGLAYGIDGLADQDNLHYILSLSIALETQDLSNEDLEDRLTQYYEVSDLGDGVIEVLNESVENMVRIKRKHERRAAKILGGK